MYPRGVCFLANEFMIRISRLTCALLRRIAKYLKYWMRLYERVSPPVGSPVGPSHTS